MLPHLGAGAGQGIEDAEMLGRLLSHPETAPDNVEVSSALSCRKLPLEGLIFSFSKCSLYTMKCVVREHKVYGRAAYALGRFTTGVEKVAQRVQDARKISVDCRISCGTLTWTAISCEHAAFFTSAESLPLPHNHQCLQNRKLCRMS